MSYQKKRFYLSGVKSVEFNAKKNGISGRKVRTHTTRKRENTDVVIIISGENQDDIASELLSTLRKARRKYKLSYYITRRATD